jgi:hypothetical protein
VVLFAELYEALLEVPDAVQPVVLCEVLPVVPYVGLFAEPFVVRLEELDAVQPVVPYVVLSVEPFVVQLEELDVVPGTVPDSMQILQMLITVSKLLIDQSFSFLSPNNIYLSFILTNPKQIVKVFLDLFLLSI